MAQLCIGPRVLDNTVISILQPESQLFFDFDVSEKLDSETK